MRIGIDYTLATCSFRGMGRYIREIVHCLFSLDNEHEYFLYTHKPIPVSLPYNFKERHIPCSNVIISEQIFLPFFAHKDHLDVLWCPCNTFPITLSSKTKLLVTIHDLIFFYENAGKKTFTQKVGSMYRKGILKFFSRRIDACCTVSEYSRKEIDRVLNIKIPIHITYNCVDSFYHKVDLLKEVINTPRDNYFFTVSGDTPSKNLNMVLHVFEEFFPSQRLIIAGVKQSSLLRNNRKSNIVFLDEGISDEELIRHYLQCKCFLFMSLYEGFGIPVLEARVCGCNIIASNTTSIPEVLGGQGILSDPTEVGLSQAIQAFLNEGIGHNIHKAPLKDYLYWSKSAKIIKDICSKFEIDSFEKRY